MNWKKSKDAAAKADPGAEKAAPGAGGPAEPLYILSSLLT